MADIKLRIEVNPNAETETLGTITNKVNDVGSNSNLSNVSFKADSSGVYADRSITNENGREMLSWANIDPTKNDGVLKFNSEGLLSTDGVVAGALASETDPDMFVWGAVPENKQYSVKLTFSNATSLKDIVVYGDKTANQFPTKAIIDGTKTIYSDDYQWAINMETESGTHTIEFVEWNRANYNACLTRIMVMLRYFDLDRGWISSVESLAQGCVNSSPLDNRPLASSGAVSLVDVKGEFADYVIDKIITLEEPISIYVNSNLIQKHLISAERYNINTRVLDMDLSNRLSYLEENRQYSKATRSSKYTQFGIYAQIILNKLNDWIITDGNALNLLNNTMIIATSYKQKDYKITLAQYLRRFNQQKLPTYTDTDTWIEFINKFCEATGLNLILQDNGIYNFICLRPINNAGDNDIIIPKYMMLSNIETDLLNKISYDNVDYTNIHKKVDNIVKVIDKTISLRDDDGNFTLAKLGEYSQTGVNNDGNYYIGFFIDLSSTDAAICNLVSAYDENKISPFNIEFVGESDEQTPFSESTGQSLIAENSDSLLTKQNYDFKERHPYIEILPYYSTKNAETFAICINGSTRPYTDYNSVHIEIYMTVISEDTNATQINDGNKIYSLDTASNYFINDTVLYEDAEDDISYPVYEYLANNIISDYKDGRATASVEVFCGDYYNIKSEKQIDWASGQMFKVGDIVRLVDSNKEGAIKYPNGDPYKWIVTGRRFKYSGSPTVELELLEVRDWLE